MDIQVGKLGRSFLAWWAGELASLLPGPVRKMLHGAGARLEVTIEDGHLVLDLFDDAGRRRTARLPWPGSIGDRSAGRTIRSFMAAADEVVLRLPPGQVLRTTFDLPLSAGAALEESLAGEIARRTPFGIGETRWDWRVRASDLELERLYVDILIARRRDLSNMLAEINSVGIAPERVEGPRQAEADGQEHLNLLPHDARERRRPWRERLVRPLTFAVLALAVAWGAVALERRKSELEALEQRLAALRTENEAVAAMEARFDELVEIRSFLAEKKRTAVPFVAVMADVTQRLPDGDWLYGYSETGGSISLQGLSRDASRLPMLLERSDYLVDVSFAAPVRRSNRDDLEDFSIMAAVGGPR